jgi:hypothetical protein
LSRSPWHRSRRPRGHREWIPWFEPRTCPRKSTARAIAINRFHMNLVLAASGLFKGTRQAALRFLMQRPPCRSEEKRRKIGCPASHPPSNCPSSATLPD